MFAIIAGRRGTGKTAMGVHTLQAAIRRKKNNTCWANFFWSAGRARGISGCSFFADKLTDAADMHHGTFVLDEAYLEVGNADWKMTPLENACLRMSRHLELDIYLITINYRDLNTTCRRTADEIWLFHKLWRFSWYSAYLPQDIDDEGSKKPKAKSIGFGWFFHSKRIHEAYDDKAILLDALKNRPPRKWRPNTWGEGGI